jgi:4-hydroxybenzoate polyprenyltransferase
LGNFSILIRGLIQTSYFFFVIFLLYPSINVNQILIGVLIILIYTTRALVADIRDVRHNKEAGKQTIPVVFGNKISKTFIAIILLSSVLIQIVFFNSYLVALPLVLFAIAVIFFSNGYILHQLMILTASFFHINFIAFFTNQNLIFFNIIYLGIFLNFIFYPLLQRRSNPTFVS